MAETWRVVDETGAAHEVTVERRGAGAEERWWAYNGTREALSYRGARHAVTHLGQSWGVVEVLAPGAISRADLAAEVAHLEGRRGALLAEIDRLRALQLPRGAL